MKKEQVIDYGALGNRILKEREAKGMSQQRLAALVPLDPSNISHIERGTGRVSLNSLMKIAIALETTPNQLLGDSFPARQRPAAYVEVQSGIEEEAKMYRKIIRTVGTYLRKVR